MYQFYESQLSQMIRLTRPKMFRPKMERRYSILINGDKPDKTKMRIRIGTGLIDNLLVIQLTQSVSIFKDMKVYYNIISRHRRAISTESVAC